MFLGSGWVKGQVTYTWNVASGDWTASGSWTPSRNSPVSNDVLVFDGSTQATATVTAVPAETIGRLRIINNAAVTFSTATAVTGAGTLARTTTAVTGTGTSFTTFFSVGDYLFTGTSSNTSQISVVTSNTSITTLESSTIASAAYYKAPKLAITGNEPGLDIAAGSSLTLNATTPIIIFLPTGATGSVSGTITFSKPGDRLDCTDVSSITFNSGSTAICNSTFTGNCFGAVGTQNVIVFASGSTFKSQAGSNPLGLSAPNSKVNFQAGSDYYHEQSGIPSFSGRTYANYILNFNASLTTTGGSAVSINDLTVNLGTLNMNMTGVPGHSIKGNITVASGATLFFNPATPGGTVNLNGSSQQTISGAGTITTSLTPFPSTLVINNSSGVIIDKDITLAGNLTVGAAGALTINSTKTLTANGPVVVQSDATNSGSLIVSGTLSGSGSVTYQRYMTLTDWHMAGSPFTTQTINAAFLSANSINGMKDYSESADNWSTDYFTTAPDVAFSLGKGYATKLSASGTVALTGTINSATANVTLTRANFGWTLLSNPFTSAINATVTAHATNNLITANTAVIDPSYVALYIWDQGTTSYKIINNAGDGSLVQNYLQVGQGFFVKSKTGGGTFTMTPAMQSHQTATAFKASNASTWAGITLNAETSAAKASTQISYQENMSRGLDIGYDAGIMKSSSFALYSRLVEDNGIDFGIQCLPTDYENLVIPIGLDAKAGDIIKFSVNAVNIPEEYAVVLEDRVTNTFKSLSEAGTVYSIQLTNDINGTGRFFVRTSFKSALGIGDLDTENAFKVFTRPNNQQIVIHGEVLANTTARIYSITGKQVAVVNLKQSSENLVQFNQDAGVYIVKISNEQGTTTQKFAWVK